MTAAEDPAPSWSVYLLRCGDGSLYTGISTDVDRRLAEHREGRGRGAKSLRGKRPLRLAAQREIGGRDLATRVEDRIKRLSKARKEELVREPERVDRLIADVGSEQRADRS